MPRLVAAAGVPYVVMHWRGHSQPDAGPRGVRRRRRRGGEELRRRVDAVVAEGVNPGLIVLDPGLGFAKIAEHNWALLTHLDQIAAWAAVPSSRSWSAPRASGSWAGCSRHPMVPRARSPAVTTRRSRSPRWRRRPEHGAPGSMRCRRTPTRYGSARPGVRLPGRRGRTRARWNGRGCRSSRPEGRGTRSAGDGG